MGGRVTVVGSSGFLGTALVSKLQDEGVETLALSRKNAPDLTDLQADWETLFEGSSAVINCAGKAHDLRRLSREEARTYALVNGVTPGGMARAAYKVGIPRFVQLSTAKVLGDHTNGRALLESDIPSPRGVYALSKALGEGLVLEAADDANASAVVVRVPLVIGRPFKGNLALLEKAIRAGIPLPLNHSSVSKRSYVQLEDLLEVLTRVALLKGPLPEILHVRSEPDMTASELADFVWSSIGMRPKFVSVPASLLTSFTAALGRGEMAAKLTGEFLLSDEASRKALHTQGV